MGQSLQSLSECAATAQVRKGTGLSLYFTSCVIRGMTTQQAYSNFVMGLDSTGEQIKMEDYGDRGRTLAAVFKLIMGDHWG